MGGRIDRIDLHRSRANIGDVMPSPRRNEDTPAVRNFLFKSQFVFRGSHLHPATASVEAQELICLWMCFKANVLADGDRHQCHLQIAPAPCDGTIICVFLRRVFNVERLRLWANVIDRHFSLHSERSTIMRELSALIAWLCGRSDRGGSREPKGECPLWSKSGRAPAPLAYDAGTGPDDAPT